MADFVIAFDQGTTSSRTLIFDAEGEVRASAAQEFPQIYPQPGWVEHDPEIIWQSQVATAHAAMAQAGLGAGDIAAIGITNQRETTVVWDRATGRPICNAIVWQCRRTADMCEQLRAQGLEPEVRTRTGLILDAYFSGTKLAWILGHVEGARERAAKGELCFGTIDSWLLYRLTGRHATDPSNASRTMLYNIHAGQWDDRMLDALGIPREVLPEVRPTSHVYGSTTALGSGIPVAAVCGDQQSALFGQDAFHAGACKNTYGTGCFLLMNTGAEPVESRHGLLTTIAWELDGAVTYALEGSVFVAGAAVQWLRDEMGLIDSAADVEALAASIPDAGGVYMVPAFVGLGAPHWDMDARGAIIGLTRDTGRAHIARAALESISYQSSDVLRSMESDMGTAIPSLKVDGGASKNDLLMQHQADVLGVPVVRGATTETTALGAAFLAGLATGFWPGIDALDGIWHEDRVFHPTWDDATRRKALDGWRRALDRVRTKPTGTRDAP